ncbi:unnamed protein product [Spirodela intermedia]|uniref:Zinc finger PHD-type domain-containing protein n=1 Tax=Spirodela intermedia TaxID=51605 RepID=A0A7I8IX53_SPIIN|nr:unnamed protein product [Spirodela intermedia]CAA6661570.1 unnamed protein product [Spirodela intermedia]
MTKEKHMPGVVTEYHFVDEKDEPVCFSLLPVQWSEDEIVDVQNEKVFLQGKTDDGLQKIYKQVVAWKVEILGNGPQVKVLSKDKTWLKIQKPRNAYQDTIRNILITLECLFYLKRNPSSSDKSLWGHVRKALSQFEVRACKDDLIIHQTLIQSIVERDDTLSNAKVLPKLLRHLSKKRSQSEVYQTVFQWDLKDDQKTQKFNLGGDGGSSKDGSDDDDNSANDDGDEFGEDVGCLDHVCAICDNGGELLCCEGECRRSFHATKGAGIDSHCKTLGYTRAQVHAIQKFFCPNCLHKRHQCFACGQLGNSDKQAEPEVFRCISASCGHFYHPGCVAKLLLPENEGEGAVLEAKIAAGESFLCPAHKCRVCKQFENKEVKELQFAMCRRCPKSYHRKCLPRRISFEDPDCEETEQRAWDDLIPNRILIYCLKHKIDKEIGTPVRNHMIFPGIMESEVVPLTDSDKKKVLVKRKAEVSFSEKKPRKLIRMPSDVEANDYVASRQPLHTSKNLKTSATLKKISKDCTKNVSTTEQKVPSKDDKACSPVLGNGSQSSELAANGMLSNIPSEEDQKVRISLLVKQSSSSSLKVKDLLQKKRFPAAYLYSEKHVGKTITQGKVEDSIEAIRAALQKIDNGCSIEDAKAVCGPDILNQILVWKKELRFYLAPFLHGLPLSTCGGHVRKVSKVEEISNLQAVERLHWYVQNGDMILDFGCEANDFSLLMKKKLESTGKECSFQNYDIFPPKSDSNFESRDWTTVEPTELLPASQLIIGLNLPFGVNSDLANKFIDKALTFNPKLLFLVAPKEPERLDTKPEAYDLLWEYAQKLSGQSHLPGSVDASDNQIEEWNMRPPFLYLWSRPDWTSRHSAIAMKRGHTLNDPKKDHLGAEDEPSALTFQPQDHNLEDRASESKDGGALPMPGPTAAVSSLRIRGEGSTRAPGPEPEERKSNGPSPHQAGPEDQQECNPSPDPISEGASGLGNHRRPFVDSGRSHRGLWSTSSVPRGDIEAIRRRYETPSGSGSSSYERFSGPLRNSLDPTGEPQPRVNEESPMHGHHEFIDLQRGSRNNNSPQATFGQPGSYPSHRYNVPGLPGHVVSSGLPRRLGDGGMREMPGSRPPHLNEASYLQAHYMPGTMRYRLGGENLQEISEHRPARHAEMDYFHGRSMAAGTQAMLEPRRPPHAGPGYLPDRFMSKVPESRPHYPHFRRWYSGGWPDE